MDDKAIIRMFFDRDENGLSAASKKYGAYCLKIAKNILGNNEDAEECVNDAYLNAWNSIPPKNPENLAAYLAKIVRNLSFNLYKKNHAEKRGCGQIPLVLDELAEIVSGKENPEKELDGKLLSEKINLFLSQLTAEKRNIFVCRYFYSDSIKDIAEKFDMTENNVSVTLNRLRTKLHNYLIESGFEI